MTHYFTTSNIEHGYRGDNLNTESTDRQSIYGKRREMPGGWNPSLTRGQQTRKEPAPTGSEYRNRD